MHASSNLSQTFNAQSLGDPLNEGKTVLEAQKMSEKRDMHCLGYCTKGKKIGLFHMENYMNIFAGQETKTRAREDIDMTKQNAQ